MGRKCANRVLAGVSIYDADIRELVVPSSSRKQGGIWVKENRLAGVRILIADDQEALRRGVRSLIATHSKWEACGEAVDGLDAVEKAKSSRPDVLILDITMPKLSGLQAVPLIKNELPDSEILILSQHDPEQARRLAFEAGARNFISKTDMARDLLTVIHDLVGRDGRTKAPGRSSELAAPDSGRALPRALNFLPAPAKWVN